MFTAKQFGATSGLHPAVRKPLSKDAIATMNQIASTGKSQAMQKAPAQSQQTKKPKSKKELAKEAVENFRNTTNSGRKYSKVSKTDIIDGLLDRVANPEKVHQESLNLCGPAAFTVAWASYDPEGYVKSVIHLYRYGYFTYNNWKVTANEDTHGQSVTTGMDAVDWILLPAIRHSENAVYDYDPKTDKGVAAFTTHWEMSAWLERIKGVSETRDPSPTVSEMNAAFANGKMQILLVDWSQMEGSSKKGKGGSKKSGKPDSYINSVTGNHYVILKSKITTVGDSISFDVWTWGRIESITIKKNRLDWAVKDVFKLS